MNLMSDFIVYVKKRLDNLTLTFGGEHIKTVEIRKLSNNLYRELDDNSKANVFKICEELLEEYNWAMGVIAYDFAYRVRKQYDDMNHGLLNMYVVGGIVMIFVLMHLESCLCKSLNVFIKLYHGLIEKNFGCVVQRQ